MASGALSHIGLAKETTWGTAVPATDYLEFISESVTKQIEQMREAAIRARFDEPRSFPGKHTISGEITVEARPDTLGYLLHSALGAPTTTPQGTGAYQHIFVPRTDKFAPKCALQPYTLEIHRDLDKAFQVAGAVVNDLSLEIGTDQGILRAVASVIAKSQAEITKTTPSFSALDPFLFPQLSVQIGGEASEILEKASVKVMNGCAGVWTLNGSRDISRIDRTQHRQVQVQFTFDVDDVAEYDKFIAQTRQAFTLTFDTGVQIGASGQNYKVVIDLPKVNYEAFPLNVGGPGRLSIQVTGRAEYDATAGYAVRVTLVNGKSSY